MIGVLAVLLYILVMWLLLLVFHRAQSGYYRRLKEGCDPSISCGLQEQCHPTACR